MWNCKGCAYYREESKQCNRFPQTASREPHERCGEWRDGNIYMRFRKKYFLFGPLIIVGVYRK